MLQRRLKYTLRGRGSFLILLLHFAAYLTLLNFTKTCVLLDVGTLAHNRVIVSLDFFNTIFSVDVVMVYDAQFIKSLKVFSHKSFSSP